MINRFQIHKIMIICVLIANDGDNACLSRTFSHSAPTRTADPACVRRDSDFVRSTFVQISLHIQCRRMDVRQCACGDVCSTCLAWHMRDRTVRIDTFPAPSCEQYVCALSYSILVRTSYRTRPRRTQTALRMCVRCGVVRDVLYARIASRTLRRQTPFRCACVGGRPNCIDACMFCRNSCI